MLPISNARHRPRRRAFSLLELVAVLAILGLLATAAAVRFGFDAVAVTSGEQFAYQVCNSLRHARRAAISTGDDHYVLFNRSSGVVVSFDTYREGGAGDTRVDSTIAVPNDVTVTTASDRWEFGFDGSVDGATTAGSLQIGASGFTWTITVQHGTGVVRVAKASL